MGLNIKFDKPSEDFYQIIFLKYNIYKMFNVKTKNGLRVRPSYEQLMNAIVEGDNDWYINALEIVKETIEYVLGKDNIDQYYLHWSG